MREYGDISREEWAGAFVVTKDLSVFNTRHDAIGHAAVLNRAFPQMDFDVKPVRVGHVAAIQAAQSAFEPTSGAVQ